MKPNDQEKKSKQTNSSLAKNYSFFLEEYEAYQHNVGSLDSYKNISVALNRQLSGVERLLDLGNGGVFDYDTSNIKEIIGLDLFLDELKNGLTTPKNVKMIQGDALDIPKDIGCFDAVVVVMLIHHLVGSKVKDCLHNVRKLLREIEGVLLPGGKLIIVESCVPEWFYTFEKIVYRPASYFIEKLINHPSTLQYPVNVISDLVKENRFINIEREFIPKGKHVMQYGIKVPSWVTPVQPVLFVSEKS